MFLKDKSKQGFGESHPIVAKCMNGINGEF
jgi:hypothetical protein